MRTLQLKKCAYIHCAHADIYHDGPNKCRVKNCTCPRFMLTTDKIGGTL